MVYTLNDVFLGIIVAIQIVVSTAFLIRARHHREIGWLPKLLVAMASVSGIFKLFYWVKNDIGLESPALKFFWPISRILQLLNYGALIRLVRIQVQLKASQENSH